jgi:hypothetical protein
MVPALLIIPLIAYLPMSIQLAQNMPKYAKCIASV